MGKFAGFLKRVKNFMFETIPNTVGKTIAKGVFALNKAYKNMNLLLQVSI